jgi:hypothetical protein
MCHQHDGELYGLCFVRCSARPTNWDGLRRFEEKPKVAVLPTGTLHQAERLSMVVFAKWQHHSHSVFRRSRNHPAIVSNGGVALRITQ